MIEKLHSLNANMESKMGNVAQLIESSEAECLDELRQVLKDATKKTGVFERIQKRFVDFKSILLDDVGQKLTHCSSPEEQWALYKELPSIPDCDGSGPSPFFAAALLYRALWDETWPNERLGSGDNMNSVSCRQIDADRLRTKAARDKKEVIDFGPIDQQLDYLFYLTHTIGNFIPIPKPVQRFHLYCNEYWDRLLHVIELEYITKNSSGKTWSGLNEVVRNWIGESEQAAQPQFDKFIENNYLAVYCTSTGPHKTIRPFKGHSFDSTKAANLADCLADMNACIIVRGNQMLNKLEKKCSLWKKDGIPEYLTDYMSSAKWVSEGFSLNVESFLALFTKDKCECPAGTSVKEGQISRFARNDVGDGTALRALRSK